MRFLLPLVLLSALGCGAVGHRQVPPAEPAAGPRPDEGGPVILVVVDGLRRDVLAAYRAELYAADDEPDWPSGIALLRARRFHTALAERAEVPFPALGLSPLATLATGTFPGVHGVTGSRFRRATPDGRLRRYDALDARDAAHIYFGPGLVPIGSATAPGVMAALRAPTVHQVLGGRTSTASVFGPFGWGARWFVPESRAGISALLPTRVGSAAAPLFDRSVRRAALDIARGGDLPRIMTLYFRELLVESCRDRTRACEGLVPIRARQRAALKRIDGHLHDLVRTLRVAHPGVLDRTTVMIVGTGGTVDRPEHGPVLSATGLLRTVAKAAGGTCPQSLPGAIESGALGLEVDGAVWTATVARAPAGREGPMIAVRACLADGLRRLTTRSGSAVAGAAWLDARGQPVARLHPSSHDVVSASRRSRTLAKLGLALTPASAEVGAVDAIAILREGTAFDDGDRLPHGLRGGLDAPSVEAALLVASRRLAPTAVRALRTAPIELTDVAPTLAAIAGLPTTAWDRPPFLTPRPGGSLAVPRADRLVRRAPTATTGLDWRETPTAIEVAYAEPGSVWPPDDFVVRLGDQRWAWDVDAGTFPEGSPCGYTENPETRAWRCTFPLAEIKQTAVFAMVRSPDPAEDAAEGARLIFSRVIVPQGGPPTVRSVKLVCATRDAVRLAVDAEDAVGLARVSVLLADGRGAGLDGRVPALASADLALGGVGLDAEACAGGADAAGCEPQTVVHTVSAPVDVPFPFTTLAHHRRARALFGAAPIDPAPLAPTLTTLGGPTQGAYLAVRVCNLGGQCAQQPLTTDTTYAEAAGAGCP